MTILNILRDSLNMTILNILRDSVDMTILNILRDLPFSRNRGVKLADD
jgi:hypothetical protein